MTVSIALCVAPRVAVIVTLLYKPTVYVFTAKVAVVAPDGIVTLEGTVATAVLLLDSVTTAPAPGAGPFKVTVPVEEPPPRTEVGLKETEVSVAAVTVWVAVRVVPPYIAEMLTDVLAATGIVVTMNVAVVALAGMVTLVGAFATAVLLLESVTVAPPAGAGPLSVTVPVEELPPRTEVGLNETEESAAGVTVWIAVRVMPP